MAEGFVADRGIEPGPHHVDVFVEGSSDRTDDLLGNHKIGAIVHIDTPQTIADGDAARPVCSVVVEFTSNGNATVLVLGDMTDVSSREHVSIQLDGDRRATSRRTRVQRGCG